MCRAHQRELFIGRGLLFVLNTKQHDAYWRVELICCPGVLKEENIDVVSLLLVSFKSTFLIETDR